MQNSQAQLAQHQVKNQTRKSHKTSRWYHKIWNWGDAEKRWTSLLMLWLADLERGRRRIADIHTGLAARTDAAGGRMDYNTHNPLEQVHRHTGVNYANLTDGRTDRETDRTTNHYPIMAHNKIQYVQWWVSCNTQEVYTQYLSILWRELTVMAIKCWNIESLWSLLFF